MPKYSSEALACVWKVGSPPSPGREGGAEHSRTLQHAVHARPEKLQTLEEHDVREGSSDSDTTSPLPTINE